MKYLKIIFLTLTFLNSKFAYCVDYLILYLHPRYESYFQENTKTKKINELDLELIRAIDKYNLWGDIWFQNETLDKIKNLINQGANINIQCDNGKSLLYLACREGDAEILRLLINLKADPKEQNLSQAIDIYLRLNKTINQNTILLFKILIKAGGIYFDYKTKNKYNISLLGVLIEYHNRGTIGETDQKIKKIIETKEKIIDEINIIIDDNNINKTKELLLKGYKFFYDIDQNNMLHIAASKNKPDIFILIFKVLPELIYEENRWGKTPIDLNPNMLMYLINYKRSKAEKALELKLDEEKNSTQEYCNLM